MSELANSSTMATPDEPQDDLAELDREADRRADVLVTSLSSASVAAVKALPPVSSAMSCEGLGVDVDRLRDHLPEPFGFAIVMLPWSVPKAIVETGTFWRFASA